MSKRKTRFRKVQRAVRAYEAGGLTNVEMPRRERSRADINRWASAVHRSRRHLRITAKREQAVPA